MSRTFTAVAVSALALALSAGSVLAQDFRALARTDLQAAHDELAANHPAPAVGGAAAQTFAAWLDTGLADALGKVGQVNSGDSHAYLIRYYARGFRDANIVGSASYDTQATRFFATSWPGIATAWKDGQYVVTYVQPGLRGAPRVGSVVTECNLQPIEEYAKAKLDLWEGDLNTEAGRVNSAPYLLWNRNNPFAGGVPSTCKFAQGRGRGRDVEMRPQPADAAALETAYRASVYTPGPTPLSIETVNGRPWINVHSFADEGYDAFNAALEGQLATIRGPQGFVLDLRGGGGASALGSSARGYGTVNRIWTPEFAQSVQPSGQDFTHRATADNREWYATVVERMKQDARFVYESPQVIASTEAIVAAYDAAIAAGQATFKEPAPVTSAVAVIAGAPTDAAAPATPAAPAAPAGPAANPVQGPVIVLVDAGCGGGCLDMVELLSRLPNVRIAGSVTPTDSIFIEQTVTRLPSNYSNISYGHKAWTSRERPTNTPISPAEGLAYTGNPTDEQAVRTWVATLFGA